MSPSDKHLRPQTAFRLPEAVLVWLREQAEREGRSMTAITIEALEAYRAGRIVPLSPNGKDQGS